VERILVWTVELKRQERHATVSTAVADDKVVFVRAYVHMFERDLCHALLVGFFQDTDRFRGVYLPVLLVEEVSPYPETRPDDDVGLKGMIAGTVGSSAPARADGYPRGPDRFYELLDVLGTNRGTRYPPLRNRVNEQHVEQPLDETVIDYPGVHKAVRQPEENNLVAGVKR
jgi:hypothetical protein